jgi:hypothetical protein
METINKNKIHTEQTFETAIIQHLCANGWTEGTNTDFDRELAFNAKSDFSICARKLNPKNGKNWCSSIKAKQKANL